MPCNRRLHFQRRPRSAACRGLRPDLPHWRSL